MPLYSGVEVDLLVNSGSRNVLDPIGSATRSKGMRGYISVMVILKFISLFKEIVLLQIIDEIL